MNIPFKKHIKLFLSALCILGFLSGCSEDFLDEEVLDSYAPEVLTDRLGFEAAVIGLHYQYGTMFTTTDDQTIRGVWQLGTDIAWAPAGRSNGDARPYFDYEILNSTDNAARKIWGSYYRLINNANILIQSTSGETVQGVTSEEMAVFRAEGKFFRALAYHNLVTHFGDVPLLTEPLAAPKTDFVRTPVAEVDNIVVQDLLEAVESLPNIGEAAENGRANKEMARQLLAEVYLRRGEDAKAEEQCTEIINGGRLSLVRDRYGVRANDPGDAFSDMFLYGNQRRSQGNTEGIWVLEAENPADVTGGSSGAPQQRRVWVASYHDLPGMHPSDTTGGRGLARMRLNDWVVYGLYADNDMRNSKYSIKRTLYFNNPDPKYDAIRGQEVPYGKDAEFILDDGSSVKIFAADTIYKYVPYTLKWGQYDIRDNFGWGMWKDFILMRLGETYLLRAEARFKQGNLDGAAADINVLRDRAHTDMVSASDIDLDFILDERVRELLAEENRRKTLVRTGTLVERAKRLSGEESLAGGAIETTNGLSENHLLMPIPQTEIDLNKDADLGQNSGY
ncbi:RagB/SusD family nutrient uptake outer membrane protein [Echinicola shivajiensis]|uniref:RagB/SusD family nutrient uptake outer membrane protein n=1 Tax=Echinicola shivajiensis TaxID=1035916 RepID=UPI001BFC5187|nr:RagB/SusD family nutrient uptake outer membrane protein [Echinicola shivajiensis]